MNDDLSPHLVEVNITELCNRTCSFCPRSHGYPNLNLNMDLTTAQVIANQCVGFVKNIHIVGRGEPLLNSNFLEIVKIFSNSFSVKIVTNGDHLHKHVLELDRVLNLRSGNHKITISVYDGDEQFFRLKDLYKDFSDIKLYKSYDIQTNIYDDNIAKKQWLSNRSGFIPVNRLKDNSPCYLPLNRMFIDYDGSVNLCCHDWNYKTVYGNIFDKDLKEIWKTSILPIAKNLLSGNRSCTRECAGCDVTDDPLKFIYSDYIESQNKRILMLNEIEFKL